MPISTTRHYMIVARHPDWRKDATAHKPLAPEQWLFQKNVREQTDKRPEVHIEFMLADAAMLSAPQEQDLSAEKKRLSTDHLYHCTDASYQTAYRELTSLQPFIHPNDYDFYQI